MVKTFLSTLWGDLLLSFPISVFINIRKRKLWFVERQINFILDFLNNPNCELVHFYGYLAQNPLQREWSNFPFANWNGISQGLPLQLLQLIKVHFLPHLVSFMWEQKFEKKEFQKKSYTTPKWGAFHLQTTISKRELP